MAGDLSRVPVSHVATPVIGGTPSRNVPEYWNGPIRWATAKDISAVRSRYLFSTEESISQLGLDQSAAKVMPRGTVVITARGTVGALAQLGADMAFNQTCYGLVPKKGVDQNYLFYVLKGASSEMRSLTYGTVFETITTKTFDQWTIPLPSLAQQRAIAHILGTLDDKIELDRQMTETLEAMARALFKSWFVDFAPVRAKAEGRDTGLPQHLADLFPDRFEDSELGEIPEEWGLAPLPQVIDVNPTRRLRKGEVAPYLDMANMPKRGHSPDAVIDRPLGSGMRFVNGDTLVARITPCLENGKTAYVDFLKDSEVGWGSTEYIVLRPRPPLPTEFAYCLARSQGFREFAIQSMTGTSGRQRVPVEALSHYLLVSPPPPISEQFGRLVKPLFVRATEAMAESRTLAALRDALLPKLLSGEIRVKDAERYLVEVL